MKTPPTQRVLPRRDRIAILAALGLLAALSWAYLVPLASGMEGMGGAVDGMGGAVDGMGGAVDGMHGGMAMLEIRPWTGRDAVMMFLMWAIMMIGMMIPTAAPMTLVYAAVARKASRQGTPIASTASFVTGYVTMWTLFSVGATAAQWALDQAALLSPMMVSTSPTLGAALLAVAGLYQLTPWKHACLQHCRAPAAFFAEHWQPGTLAGFRLGLHHGAFCIGCCWVLMGLLFFGGVMNLGWIAAIALFVLLEKILPAGVHGGRLAGVAMIFSGVALAAGWLAD